MKEQKKLQKETTQKSKSQENGVGNKTGHREETVDHNIKKQALGPNTRRS